MIHEQEARGMPELHEPAGCSAGAGAEPELPSGRGTIPATCLVAHYLPSRRIGTAPMVTVGLKGCGAPVTSTQPPPEYAAGTL